jgi:hypothetical protein
MSEPQEDQPQARQKNPRRVAAGKARQQQLRADLGEEGYQERQRMLHDRAVNKHPTMKQRGGVASNAAQLAALGEAGYRAQRQAAYQACTAKYGAAFARKCVAAAHEERRRYRLANPTAGEAALRQCVSDLGYQVMLATDPPVRFEDWLDGDQAHAITEQTAVPEAYVGPYMVDLLLPYLRLAVEVEGGIHTLRQERDYRRRIFLEYQGLTVLVFTNAAMLDGSAVERIHQAIRERQMPPGQTWDGEMTTWVARQIRETTGEAPSVAARRVLRQQQAWNRGAAATEVDV